MNFVPKKSLGQNFLKDQKIIDSIVEIGDIRKDDVIEIFTTQEVARTLN